MDAQYLKFFDHVRKCIPDAPPSGIPALNEWKLPISHYQCVYILNFKEKTVPLKVGVKEFLGYEDEEFDFNFILNNFHPDDYETVTRLISAAVTFGMENKIGFDNVFRLSYRVRKKNGEYIKVLRHSKIIEVDDNGRIVSNITILSDISFIKFSDTVFWDFEASGLDKENFRKSVTRSFKGYFSERQVELLQLLAKGLNSSEIAATLFISKHTVDTHRRAMLKKANCLNTIELLNFCSMNGIV